MTDCVICETFIWQSGGAINGKSVCKPCVEGLAAQSGIALDEPATDAWLAEIYNDIENEVRSAADAAIESALRLHRPKKAQAVA